MRFGIYSELQHWPGKSVETLYGEVLEQMVNVDRLGYTPTRSSSTCSSPSSPPRRTRLPSSRRPRSGRGRSTSARCSTSSRTTTPSSSPRRSTRWRSSPRGGTSSASAVATGDPAGGRTAARRGEQGPLRRVGRALHRGADQTGSGLSREVLVVGGLAHRPVPRAALPRRARRHLRPHLRARRPARLVGGRAPAAPVRRAEDQLDLYRRRCADHGRRRTSSGSTPPTSTRTATSPAARPRPICGGSWRATHRR